MLPITVLMGLAQYAPALIKLITGSDKAEEVAEKVIDVAKTVTGTDSGEEALKTIQGSPELQVEFHKAIMANEQEWERLYLSDLQDARKRDTAFVTQGVVNHRANAMASMAALLVVICLAIMVWKTGIDETAKAAITLILGRALGWIEQVFSFEFGTTRSSKGKDDTISHLSRK